MPYNHAGIIPRLGLVAMSDTGLANESVDERIDDRSADGLGPHYEYYKPELSRQRVGGRLGWLERFIFV